MTEVERSINLATSGKNGSHRLPGEVVLDDSVVADLEQTFPRADPKPIAHALTSSESLQDVNFGRRPDRVAKLGTAAVDKDEDVLTKHTLVVEHVIAQPAVAFENVFERRGDGFARDVLRGTGNEALQVRSEDDVRHQLPGITPLSSA